MIDNTIQPQQILLIDDNEAWLNSLAGLGVIVFNGKDKSQQVLVDFIQPIESSLSVVVVNIHLLQTMEMKRVDNNGLLLVEELLKIRFPNLQFIFVSFCTEFNNTNPCLIYEDFLTHIKEAHNYKTNDTKQGETIFQKLLNRLSLLPVGGRYTYR
jgi:hypothetical protein